MKLLLICLLFTGVYGEDFFKDYSIYPLGFVKHMKKTSKTHEGNMNYLVVAKTIENNLWNYEVGAGTFVDSYNVRSYRIYTNFSHDDYKWRILTPMIGVDCNYKGKEYTSNKKRLICFPTLRLRLGKEKGLFVNVTPVPKIGNITNGFIAAEFGYKF